MKSKLKFGIDTEFEKWHIVSSKDKIYISICTKQIWIDDLISTNDFLHPDGNQIEQYPFDLDHICKKCIKVVGIEDVKTYIIYHKLGIKQ